MVSYKIADLVPDTIESVKTGQFKRFGFAIVDYLALRGYDFEDGSGFDFSSLGDEFLVGKVLTDDDTAEDVIEAFENEKVKDWSIVVIDFSNLTYPDWKDVDEPLEIVKNLIDYLDSLPRAIDLNSYESRICYAR